MQVTGGEEVRKSWYLRLAATLENARIPWMRFPAESTRLRIEKHVVKFAAALPIR